MEKLDGGEGEDTLSLYHHLNLDGVNQLQEGEEFILNSTLGAINFENLTVIFLICFGPTLAVFMGIVILINGFFFRQ